MFAQSLHQDEILRNVQRFMLERHLIAAPTRTTPLHRNSISEFKQIGECTIALLPHKQGFVIASNQAHTAPILGYSPHSTIDLEHLPQSLRYWISTYNAQIAQTTQRPSLPRLTSAVASPALTYPIRPAIAPLCPTLWGQSGLFASKTPRVAGCVAAAMAQIMYVHRHPQDVVHDIPSYYQNDLNLHIAGIKKDTPIQWSEMLPVYKDSNSSPSSKDAVASLLQICATAAHMHFAPGNSATPTANAVKAFKQYLGYNPNIRMLRRSQFTQADWENTLYRELAEGRPVLYTGYNNPTSSPDQITAGHAFVCDGFDGKGFYHINWGWQGASNGFFRLSVLNPSNNTAAGASASHDGYSTMQEMVIGIQPATPEQMKIPYEKCYNADITGASTKSIDLLIHNANGQANNRLGIAIEQENGTWQVIYDTNVASKNQLGYTNTNPHLYWSDTKAYEQLPQGTSKLVLVCRPQGWNKWVRIGAEDNYVIAHRDDNKYSFDTFSSNSGDIFFSEGFHLAVEGEMQPCHIRYNNAPANISARISNSGKDFLGALYVYVSTRAGERGNYAFQTNASIPHNKIRELHFFPQLHVGVNYISLCVKENKQLKTLSTLTITHPEVSTDTRPLTITKGFPATVNGSHFASYITISNPTDKAINIDKQWSAYAQDLFYGGRQESVNINAIVPPHSDSRYPIDFGTKPESRFNVTIRDASLKIIKTFTVHFTAKPLPASITYYDAQGHSLQFTIGQDIPETAAALDLREVEDLRVLRCPAHLSPNLLLYVAADAVLPDTWQERNVIKGNTAERIRLHDGYDFYIPFAFTAHHIDYQRTLAHPIQQEEGWQTLALPFTATSISTPSATYEIGPAERETDVYIRQLQGFDAQHVAIYGSLSAPQITAHFPYLIGVSPNIAAQPLHFTADHASIAATTLAPTNTAWMIAYDTHQSTTPRAAYIWSDTQTAYVPAAAAVVRPFRTYLQPFLEDLTPLSQIEVRISPLPSTTPTLVLDENDTSDAALAAAVGKCVDIQLFRTFIPNAWNSLYLPFSLTDEEVRAQWGEDCYVATVDQLQESEIQFTVHHSSKDAARQDKSIAAYTPTIVYITDKHLGETNDMGRHFYTFPKKTIESIPALLEQNFQVNSTDFKKLRTQGTLQQLTIHPLSQTQGATVIFNRGTITPYFQPVELGAFRFAFFIESQAPSRLSEQLQGLSVGIHQPDHLPTAITAPHVDNQPISLPAYSLSGAKANEKARELQHILIIQQQKRFQ